MNTFCSKGVVLIGHGQDGWCTFGVPMKVWGDIEYLVDEHLEEAFYIKVYDCRALLRLHRLEDDLLLMNEEAFDLIYLGDTEQHIIKL